MPKQHPTNNSTDGLVYIESKKKGTMKGTVDSSKHGNNKIKANATKAPKRSVKKLIVADNSSKFNEKPKGRPKRSESGMTSRTNNTNQRHPTISNPDGLVDAEVKTKEAVDSSKHGDNVIKVTATKVTKRSVAKSIVAVSRAYFNETLKLRPKLTASGMNSTLDSTTGATIANEQQLANSSNISTEMSTRTLRSKQKLRQARCQVNNRKFNLQNRKLIEALLPTDNLCNIPAVDYIKLGENQIYNRKRGAEEKCDSAENSSDHASDILADLQLDIPSDNECPLGCP